MVLGGDGMLGHQLMISLGKDHDVKCTLRGTPDRYVHWTYFDDSNAFFNTDIRDLNKLNGALDAFAPDVVINCIGIVKQRREAAESIPSIEINALAPHKVASQCDVKGIRFVHVSTDCVFDGADGAYKESDPCNVSDIYGLTKYLGEVHESNAITLRTSIIGHELSRKTGLLEWFLAQTGTVKGFKNAIFSGLTTRELAAVIDMLVTSHPDASGLYHVSSDPINKFDLLCLFREVYALDIEIEEDVAFYCDRSLNSARFQEHFDYKSPAWRDMVIAMKDDFEGRPSGF